MEMNMIFAVDRNWNIGYKGEMQFYIKKDLEHFKRLTTGHVMIMGRKTFEALPGVLDNRMHLVMSRNTSKILEHPQVYYFSSKNEIMQYLQREKIDKCFVIGGEMIVNLFYPEIEYAYITQVDDQREADTKIINLEENPNFAKVFESEVFEEDGIRFTFLEFERIKHEEL